MPAAFCCTGAAYYDGKIYVAGGYDGSSPSQTAWAYDIRANNWILLTDMPQPIVDPGFGVINGKLYIAGGFDRNEQNLNTLYAYDITANNWTRLADLPQGVGAPGSVVAS